MLSKCPVLRAQGEAHHLKQGSAYHCSLRRWPRLGFVASGLAAVGAFMLIASNPAVAARNPVGPGCDLSRPAVSYFAGIAGRGSEPASLRPRLAIPCAVVTGPTTDTATVGVSQRYGTLAYAPQQATSSMAAPAITISNNNGANWKVRTPTLQPGTGSIIPWLNQNPTTDRIWFATLGPVPSSCSQYAGSNLAQINWSDDEGKTWHSPPGDPADCRQLQGGMNVTEGPAPLGQPQPVNYPNVVYHCGNVSDGAIPLSVHCYKTLDGGQTWSLLQGPNNPPPKCTGKFGGRGRAVDLNGTFYMSVECQPVVDGRAVAGKGPLYLATSHDEGNTWSYQFIVKTSYEANESVLVSSLGVDKTGNLYLAWVDADNQPMLIVRRGSTWGYPLNVAQPGVNYVTRIAVAVRKPGDIAVAYVGSSGGQSGTFNGYISESRNALDLDPTFLGAPVNDPASPLMSSEYAESATSAGEGRIWVLSAAFGPDGTPWAGFHCGNLTNGTTTGVPAASITCPNGATPPAPPLALGVVGRLANF